MNEAIERQIAKAFFIEANTDLKAAKIAYENDIYSRCVSFNQESVEKSFKAGLAVLGIYGLMDHKVSDYFIQEFEGIIDVNTINEVKILIQSVGEDWTKSCYPNWDDPEQPIWIPSKHYNKDDAEKALFVANRIHEIIKDILESKFQLEL